MAEEQGASQAPSSDKPAKHIVDRNDEYYISIYDPLPGEPPESVSWDIDRGEETGSDEQVYCWGGPSEQQYCYDATSEGGEMFESDGQGEMDYPDDPDEVSEHDGVSEHDALSDTNEQSDHNTLSDPDTPSISKNPSASDPSSSINEQSDADLAFEVAYEYLRTLPVSASSEDTGAAETEDRKVAVVSSIITNPQRSPAPVPEHASAGDQQSKKTAEFAVSDIQQHRLARRLKREQNLSVPESSGDASKAEVELGKSAIASSIQVCPQRSPAPASAEGQQSEGAAERARSDNQQRRGSRRLKTRGDLLRAISTMESDVSKLESWKAAMLPSSKATVSDTPTSDALRIPSMIKEIEEIRSKLESIRSKHRNVPLPVRPPKASCSARFTSHYYDEKVLPSAKRMRVGLWWSRPWMTEPNYIMEKTILTLRHPGRSKRCREVIGGAWEHAQMVDLGQPTLQAVKSLSPQQWPKPLQQPIEPPPWQSFLESMKSPVQQSVDGNARQAVPQPDTEHEQQSIQQAVQQLSRLTVKDAIAQSVGKPVQLPVHAPPQKSEKNLSVEGPVKTPERFSMNIKLAKLLNIPDQPPAEEPVKKPTIRLLLGKRPVLEQIEEPTEKHSPKSSFRKNPAQRRVQRSKRLNEKSGEEVITASSEAACLQQKPQNGLAVSGITVVCDFQPTTPDISPSSPPRTLPTFAPESETVKLKLHSTSPNPPAQEPTLTTSLQSLTLTESANPCSLFRTLPLEIHTSSPAQSPIPSTSSPP